MTIEARGRNSHRRNQENERTFPPGNSGTEKKTDGKLNRQLVHTSLLLSMDAELLLESRCCVRLALPFRPSPAPVAPSVTVSAGAGGNQSGAGSRVSSGGFQEEAPRFIKEKEKRCREGNRECWYLVGVGHTRGEQRLANLILRVLF